MEKLEIDYLGLRKVFESTGNRKKLDELVLTYIKKLEVQSFRERKIPYLSFLEGIELQKETIDQLSVMETYILITQYAEPKTLLLEHIFHNENSIQEFIELDAEGRIVDIVSFFEIIFEDMSLNQRIDFLYEHRKFMELFQIAQENICPTLHNFGYEDSKNYNEAISEFIDFVIKNGYSHLAFAMSFIQELYERRTEIINGWIKEGKSLELDIYSLAFIEGGSISTDLDDRYNEELQKRGSFSSKNGFVATPSNGQYV